MGKDKDEPQEEYSVEKVLQKRIRGGKVRSSWIIKNYSFNLINSNHFTSRSNII